MNSKNFKINSDNAKNKKSILIAVVACIMLIAGALFYFVGSKPTLDINKYVNVDVSGYNGYGNAKVNFEKDKLEEDFGEKIKFSDEFKKMIIKEGADPSILNLYDPMEIFEKSIEMKLDKESELSNGDEINLTFTLQDEKEYEQYLNIKVKSKPETIKVSNLKDIETKDVFKDIDVKFDGLSGYGNVTASFKDESIKGSLLITDKTDNNLPVSFGQTTLSNGDEIKVTIQDVNSFIEQNGYAPKEVSKIFTVEGLGSYIKNLSEINDEALEQLKNKGLELIQNTITIRSNGLGEVTFGDAEYIGDFLLVSSGNSGLVYNKLELVYQLNITSTNGYSGTHYAVVDLENATVDENGNLCSELTEMEPVYAAELYYETGANLHYLWKDIDQIKSKEVDENAAYYTCEWNVQ